MIEFQSYVHWFKRQKCHIIFGQMINFDLGYNIRFKHADKNSQDRILNIMSIDIISVVITSVERRYSRLKIVWFHNTHKNIYRNICRMQRVHNYLAEFIYLHAQNRVFRITVFRSYAKLYIPSTLNIALLQWHTHLNVCAVK